MNKLRYILFLLLLIGCNNEPTKEHLFAAHEDKLQETKNQSEYVESHAKEEIVIGGQVWKAYNLDVDTFLNGEPIVELKSDKDWEQAGINGTPAWSYFNNEKENSYGSLYNFHAIDDPRCLCPLGWRVPTDEDWLRLNLAIGENIAYKLKGKEGWLKSGNGMDSYNFNALPNGMRYYDGHFFYMNESAFWWTSSSVVIKHAWLRYFDEDYSDRIFRITARKGAGMGIRCMKDYSGEEDKQ
jgi:uncharacterized protein (TIGR02145 family)